jgi:hypothetical protein
MAITVVKYKSFNFEVQKKVVKGRQNNRVADLLFTLSWWKCDCEHFIVYTVIVWNNFIGKYYYV